MFQVKQSFSAMELQGDIMPAPSERGNGEGANLFKDQNQQQQEELRFDILMFEEFIFDHALQPTQPYQETTGLKNQEVASSELVECNKQLPPSLASLELLSNYRSSFKRLRGQNIDNLTNIETSLGQQKLSTEEIIRLAGARYVQYPAHWNDYFCIPTHPSEFGLGGLSEKENRDVELAQFLLAAADGVGCQQFERASRLLFHCQKNSSADSNAVQRVIFHFAQALQERIDKETGRITTPKVSEKNEEYELLQKLDTNTAVTCYQKIPFNQIMLFTGTQAIVEHVACETKIHLIDLDIKSGMHCIGLMQALKERQKWPVELVKITAIGIEGNTNLEETGKRLASFAESLNLPFLYKAIVVTEMAEINEDQFEIEYDEAVAVYSPYFLRTLVSRLDFLENLMRFIRNIKPSIMIVLETESNHNSPSFVNRFIEALFFYSAYFDAIDTCMKEDNECRMKIEAVLAEGIRNIVAMEGTERSVRNVKIDVWRRFFARYPMEETGFSESSLLQANLVTENFACGKSCTLDKNGKCLIVGWKGTPIHSISAWRFL